MDGANADTITTNETIEQLKQTLRSQLDQSGMSSVIRHMVRDVCASRGDLRSVNPDEVIQEIYKRGLMKTVLENFNDSLSQHPQDQESATGTGGSVLVHTNVTTKGDEHFLDIEQPQIKGKIHSEETGNDTQTSSEKLHDECQSVSTDSLPRPSKHGKYYLKMEILGGKAFLDHLFDDNSMSYGCPKPNFVLHVFYKSQRFSTKPTECRCDPDFKDTFMIDVGYFETGNVSQLLAINDPLRIILVRDDIQLAGGTVVSHCVHDWRPLLMSSKASERFPLELMGIGPEYRVSIGILNIRFTILPIILEQVCQSTFMIQINSEKSRQDEQCRLFLVYAKQWWKEFTQIRPEHQLRLFKILSYDENMSVRPVTTFVSPIVSDRLFLTPLHAAWFVALIPVQGSSADDLIGNTAAPLKTQDYFPAHDTLRSEHWQNLCSTIAAKSGSVEDHAILLCSLLLGFGMDVYVAVGTKKGSCSWVWVTTFDEEFKPTFWESTTGVRSEHVPPVKAELPDERVSRMRKNELHEFKTISCLFNNKSFFSNIQPSDLINRTDWTLSNPSKWKRISESCLQFTLIKNEPPKLLRSSKNTILLSSDIEVQLKTLITKARLNYNLKTRWDDSLSKLMGQQLSKYEIEASTGASNLCSYFQSVITKCIPPGYDFKGFPFHTHCSDSGKIFNLCMKERKCEEIVYCRGDDIQFSMRVDVFSYPEDITSVRLMIACKFIVC